MHKSTLDSVISIPDSDNITNSDISSFLRNIPWISNERDISMSLLYCFNYSERFERKEKRSFCFPLSIISDEVKINWERQNITLKASL